MWSRLILAISRVKVQVRGLEKLESEGVYIFVANHLSMFDIWAFLGCLPYQFKFVAKASLFRWPFLGWHLTRAGYIPVDRQHPRQILRTFQATGAKILSGFSLVIFPEGMRTWGQEVAPFKRGSFVLARYTGAAIVPVTIIGSHRRLRRGSVFIRPGKMEMIIHTPISQNQYRKLKLGTLTQKVHRTIVGSYQQVC